jgi:hypothetical protein
VTVLPNFLFLGPDKAGSSWLHEALSRHPDVFLSPAKDLYYFDRYYQRGRDWYARQFKDAGGFAVVGEVSPDYLASPDAPLRIRETLGPDVRLMVTLREPAARAFSSWLYMRKQGEGADTFSEALRTFPDLIEHGRYHSQLTRYLEHFPRSSFHIAVFDDLQDDAGAFLDAVTRFLDIDPLPHEPEVLEARLVAGQARSTTAARIARRGAEWVRGHDGARIVGRVKRSALVQRLLYRPLPPDDRPRLLPADEARVRDRLRDDVLALQADLGVAVAERWGYSSERMT